MPTVRDANLLCRLDVKNGKRTVDLAGVFVDLAASASVWGKAACAKAVEVRSAGNRGKINKSTRLFRELIGLFLHVLRRCSHGVHHEIHRKGARQEQQVRRHCSNHLSILRERDVSGDRQYAESEQKFDHCFHAAHKVNPLKIDFPLCYFTVRVGIRRIHSH